ncbi:MAG: hypothetical protein LBT04_05890 [Prevotellaceae bacterium]|jgi:hypothetical protein|nr:hypothetical protein [Prevotellaceae bacterium]
MNKNAIILIIAAVILLVGIVLLAMRKFRNALCSSKGQSINNYIAKLTSNIATIAGVMIGVNLIVEVQPIVENYTTLQSKKNVIVRDTVVIARRDTVFIPKEIPQNKPNLEADEVRKAKQEMDNYIKKQKQEIGDYVKQQETDMSNYRNKTQQLRVESAMTVY